MVEHLDHAPLHAQGVDGEEPQHHKTHVADAGASDQPLHIGLGQQHKRFPVGDPNHRQPHQPRKAEGGGVRQHRQVEPQKAIGAELQQHPGQQHAPGGRRLRMGQRQPGMHRKQRQQSRTRQTAAETPASASIRAPRPSAEDRSYNPSRQLRDGKRQNVVRRLRVVPQHDRQQSPKKSARCRRR